MANSSPASPPEGGETRPLPTPTIAKLESNPPSSLRTSASVNSSADADADASSAEEKKESSPSSGRNKSRSQRPQHKDSIRGFMKSAQSRSRHGSVSSGGRGRSGGSNGGRGSGGRGRGSTAKQWNKRTWKSISFPKSVHLNSPTSAKEADDKTRELAKDRDEFSSGASVKKLADELFGSGSGISNNDLRRLIDTKIPKHVTPYENDERIIKNLKAALSSIIKAKGEFISGAIEAERAARMGWHRALQSAKDIDADRAVTKNKMKQLETDATIWKDNAKDSMRELSVAEAKIQGLKDELEVLKEKLGKAEQMRTEAMIAMEVAKSRSETSIKECKGLKEEIATLEAAKAEAVKKATAEVAGASGTEKTALLAEISGQKDRVKELEMQLQKKDLETQKLLVEKDAAVEKASSKDRDLSELMKSLGDIQRSGTAREEEANKLRKEAEGKVSDLERASVDLRGEISVLTHEKMALSDSLEKAKTNLDGAEGSVKELKEQIDGFKTEISLQSAQLSLEKELRTRSEQKESEERTERIALSAQMVAMTKEHALMEAQLNEANEILEAKWRKQLKAQEDLVEEKEKNLAEARDAVTGLEGEIASLKQALKDQKSEEDAQHAEEVSKLNGEISRLQGRVRAEEEKLVSAKDLFAKERADFEAQLREGAAERRKMHNVIQELRGNVRVFARVRPFLPGDNTGDNEQPCVIPKSDTALKLKLNGEEKKDYNFSFDRVFNPSSSQEAVFAEVSEFVQSALDGYSVCLFSYGQTGSGKTHTMQGSGLGQMRGIIPRAIEKVGEYKRELEGQGWQYEMKVSFLEIYNETIRDLLRDEEIGEKKHDIKVNADGSRFITDLTICPLEPTDTDAVNDVMETAAKYRTVGSTKMNDVSSRSHSVFTLHLTARHPENNQKLKGTLNLVDLAGSERLKRSGAAGEQAKEAVSINKSLSSLTNVFVSIGSKAGHIPFRNSKLTYLLQPSLSGDGKTLMIVNISPTEMSTQESLSSLRFAAQVNKCELGAAKRSIQEAGSDDEDDDASVSSKSSVRSTSSKSTPSSRRSTPAKSAPSSRRSSLQSPSSTPLRRIGSTPALDRTTPANRKKATSSGIPTPRRNVSSNNLKSSGPGSRTSRLTRPTSSANPSGKIPTKVSNK